MNTIPPQGIGAVSLVSKKWLQFTMEYRIHDEYSPGCNCQTIAHETRQIQSRLSPGIRGGVCPVLFEVTSAPEMMTLRIIFQNWCYLHFRAGRLWATQG